MDQITLGATLFLTLVTVYFIVKPFLDSKSENSEFDKINLPDNANENADKLRADRLVTELEDLKEQYRNANLSEAEYEEQRQLLLKDAAEIIS